MIQVQGLTKRYGDKVAVDDPSFTVHPGRVTGFLGPNGAGKSTTVRLILGLDAPTRGSATVNGRPYRQRVAPLREVGALLEARSLHPARSAYHHLVAIAETGGIARSRVEEVVDLVGLREVVHRRAGRFSLGMGQRLGIATAMLGDPRTGQVGAPAGRAGHRARRDQGRQLRLGPELPRPGRHRLGVLRPARLTHTFPPPPPGGRGAWVAPRR